MRGRPAGDPARGGAARFERLPRRKRCAEPVGTSWHAHGILTEGVPAGLPVAEQRVLFGGRQLGAGAPLAAAGVADADTLHILARLLGGGKKRKKKTYTKPKKQKHKHKKIKMRVLKFFKARRPPRARPALHALPYFWMWSWCVGATCVSTGCRAALLTLL
jgi:hypothetical protein